VSSSPSLVFFSFPSFSLYLLFALIVLPDKCEYHPVNVLDGCPRSFRMSNKPTAGRPISFHKRAEANETGISDASTALFPSMSQRVDKQWSFMPVSPNGLMWPRLLIHALLDPGASFRSSLALTASIPSFSRLRPVQNS